MNQINPLYPHVIVSKEDLPDLPQVLKDAGMAPYEREDVLQRLSKVEAQIGLDLAVRSFFTVEEV